MNIKEITESLFTLQKMALHKGAAPTDGQATIRQLRSKVPAPVLAHFDRMISIGRSGVALVRHGICGECHLRVPTGLLASLANPADVYLCESCGCYLLLPSDELPGVVGTAKLRPVAVRKTRQQPVAG